MRERKQHQLNEERGEMLYRFWESFFVLDAGRTIVKVKAKPTERGSLSLGYSDGLAYYYVIKGRQSHVAFYIARPNEKENKRMFDMLLSCGNEIENSFGAPFVWQRLDDKVPCRIRYEMEIGEFEESEDNWQDIQTEMIDAMIRFKKSLSPYIAKFA